MARSERKQGAPRGNVTHFRADGTEKSVFHNPERADAHREYLAATYGTPLDRLRAYRCTFGELSGRFHWHVGKVGVENYLGLSHRAGRKAWR